MMPETTSSGNNAAWFSKPRGYGGANNSGSDHIKEPTPALAPSCEKPSGPISGGPDIGSNNPFDYERKYPQDQRGEEAASNARVWLTYLDEAGGYDREKVEGWKDTVDILLVFAGLFSGVITAFISQASQNLQQNYTQVSASLLFEMAQLQRAYFSGMPISNIPTSTLTPISPFTPSTSAFLVNGLWYTSLAISLVTALVAVLTKQWLHYYVSTISGTAVEKVRVRHFRFQGFELWKVGLIVDILPILLHLALGVFLIGIIIFLFPLDTRIAWTILVITGISYTLYFISLLLPIRCPGCPYVTPLTLYADDMLSYLWKTFRVSTVKPAEFRSWREGNLSKAIIAEAACLDLKALRWLYGISSNPSVRRIITLALSVYKDEDLRKVFDDSVFETQVWWTNFPMEDSIELRELQHRFLSTVSDTKDPAPPILPPFSFKSLRSRRDPMELFEGSLPQPIHNPELGRVPGIYRHRLSSVRDLDLDVRIHHSRRSLNEGRPLHYITAPMSMPIHAREGSQDLQSNYSDFPKSISDGEVGEESQSYPAIAPVPVAVERASSGPDSEGNLEEAQPESRSYPASIVPVETAKSRQDSEGEVADSKGDLEEELYKLRISPSARDSSHNYRFRRKKSIRTRFISALAAPRQEFRSYSSVLNGVLDKRYDQILEDAIIDNNLKAPVIVWRNLVARAPRNATLAMHILIYGQIDPHGQDSNSTGKSAYETGVVRFTVALNSQSLGAWAFDYLFRYFCGSSKPNYTSTKGFLETRYLLLVSIYRNLTSSQTVITDKNQRQRALEKLFQSNQWQGPRDAADMSLKLCFGLFTDILCEDIFWSSEAMTDYIRDCAMECLHRSWFHMDMDRTSRFPFMEYSTPPPILIYRWCSRVLSEHYRRVTFPMAALLFTPHNRWDLLKILRDDRNAASRLSKCLRNLQFFRYYGDEYKIVFQGVMTLFDVTDTPDTAVPLRKVLYDLSALIEAWKVLVINAVDTERFFQSIKSNLDQAKWNNLHDAMLAETQSERHSLDRSRLEASAREFERVIGRSYSNPDSTTEKPQQTGDSGASSSKHL